MDTTGAQIANTSGQALVKLQKSATLVAAQRFNYTVSGNRLYPADPAAIDAWVRSFGSTVNKAILVLDDLAMISPTGEPIDSTVQMTVLYAGVPKSSASVSYRYDYNIGPEPIHHQQ